MIKKKKIEKAKEQENKIFAEPTELKKSEDDGNIKYQSLFKCFYLLNICFKSKVIKISFKKTNLLAKSSNLDDNEEKDVFVRPADPILKKKDVDLDVDECKKTTTTNQITASTSKSTDKRKLSALDEIISV